MKKEVQKGFWPTLFGVPLTLFLVGLYLLGTLVIWQSALSGTHELPSDGNRLLSIWCSFSLVALWIVAFRLIETHHWRSFTELMWPVTWLTLALIVYACIHGFGTFLPEQYQDKIMFVPLAISALIAFLVLGRMLVNREALRHEVSHAQRVATLSKTDAEANQERILKS